MRQCPKCELEVPYGGGVERDGAVVHFWCARTEEEQVEREVRLPNGSAA